jgi:hypothetical protein
MKKIRVVLELEMEDTAATRHFGARISWTREKLQDFIRGGIRTWASRAGIAAPGVTITSIDAAWEDAPEDAFERHAQTTPRLPAGTDLPTVVSKLHGDVAAIVAWLDANAFMWRQGERLANCEAADKVEERLGERIDTLGTLG